MLKLLFILTIIFSLKSFTQVDPIQELYILSEQNFYSEKEKQQAAKKALDLFKKILTNENASFEEIEIASKKKSLKGISIIPSTMSNQGTMSFELNKWKIILPRSQFAYIPEINFNKKAEAFYDPQSNTIGIPHSFIFSPKEISEALIHEIYHANTLEQLYYQKEDLFAGSYLVNEGSFISSLNQEYYYRFGSIDELNATALSLLIDVKKMDDLKNTSDYDLKKNQINSIYFSLKIVTALNRQFKDILIRSLLSSEQEPMDQEYIVKISSYSREVKPTGGGTYMHEYRRGGSVKFQLISSEDSPSESHQDKLNLKINKLIKISEELESLIHKATKCIYIMIDYPQWEKSDLKCLSQNAPNIFYFLENQKKNKFPVELIFQ